MIRQYNRNNTRPFYPLNQRGYHQLLRNNSQNIWSIIQWKVSEQSESLNKIKDSDLQNTFETTIEKKDKKQQLIVQEQKKAVSFDVDENSQANKIQLKTNNFTRSSKSTSRMRPQLSENDKLKRKSVQKYLKDLIPYTRTLSNSAFTKFYQRPCPEAYGRKNTNQQFAFYGNFMKTHNIQPHTLDNKPQDYQTFKSALNFCKRTKLDTQDRWKKIERQLAKNLNYKEPAEVKAMGYIDMTQQNKANLLKQNINFQGKKIGKMYEETAAGKKYQRSKSIDKMTQINQKLEDTQAFQSTTDTRLKRSLSSDKPVYFIYKYHEKQDGYDCTRYARNRHGITCYVDPSFKENDKALTVFFKRIKPIYPQKCRPQDINIDNIRKQNHQLSIKCDFPRHYLTPCVQTPYEASKYSWKNKLAAVKSQK